MNITNILFSTYLSFGQVVLPQAREIVRYGGIQAIHADGTLSLRLNKGPIEEEKGMVDGGRAWKVEYKDEHYPFYVTQRVVTWPDCDVAETWVEIRHEEPGAVRLVKMDSFAAALPMTNDVVNVLTLTGNNQDEGKVVETALAPGQTLATSSREGIHNAWESNPVMMISLGGASESTGTVVGVALEWSGCSAKSVRREPSGETKIFVGVDNQGGPYVLDAGVTLRTPHAMVTLSRQGRGEVSRQFHRWAHRHLMPHGYDLHPVLLNSWEGSYFTFTEKTLTDMIDGVAEMGGEMFVLDDGWFGEGKYARDNSSGLGDWVVNKAKLPHGLGWLSDQAKARGLKFGLWVEPEMIDTNSALFAAYPDWMTQEPHRKTLLGRGEAQNTLDLCNPDVRDCVFKQIDAVYAGIPDLAYVKWDANCAISNIGSPSLPRDRQTNLWFDYVMGLYDLLARFQKARPNVMTQACASGGGRMDFGFLRYADEFWTSDRTDPVNRIFMQWGASHFYPASAMACHVTASPNKQSGRATPIKYRFDVAMSGRLGIELHPNELKADELAYAKKRIAQYKRIRPTVQQGDLYRLASPYEKPYAAFDYVSTNKKHAVLFVLGLDRELDETVVLKLEGLEPERNYLVDGMTRTGASLMTEGLAVSLKGKYASEVIEIRPEPCGTVVLGFDDRNFATWIKALPLLDEYNAHATFFINGAIDEKAVAAMRELKAHGHSLGLHGFKHAHATKLIKEVGPEAYIEQEVLPQLKAAEAAGFKIRNWGYPYSECNAETEAALAKYFDWRRTGRGPFNRDPAKIPALSCEHVFFTPEKFCKTGLFWGIGMGGNFPGLAEDLCAAIRRIAERDEVLLLNSHAIDFNQTHNTHNVEVETLCAILKEAYEQGVQVIGLDEFKRPSKGLVCEDFMSDNCGGIAGWNPLAEADGSRSGTFTILPERVANGRHVLRITGSNFLRLEAGSAKLVPGGRYCLSIMARTKNLANQKRLQYLLYGYGGWSKDWVLNLPHDTKGEWQELTQEVTLAPEGNGDCVLCIYGDKPFAADAYLDLAYPRLEAVDAKAKTGKDRYPEPQQLKPRITPVDPILSEVKANAAVFTFFFPGDVADETERYVLRAQMEGVTKTGGFDEDHRAKVDFGAIKPGRHDIALEVVGEKSGRTIAANSYLITTLVTAQNATPLKRLNNFVSEIYTKPLKNGRYEFTLEKAGWVYIVLDRPYATVSADVDKIENALRYRLREPSETQRYLRAGKHVVTVRGVSGAAAGGTISVRLIREIPISGYKHIINPSGDYPKWGYSFDYYRLFNLFGTCNTVELSAMYMSSPRAVPVMYEFENRGIKVIQSGGPGSTSPCRNRIDTLMTAIAKNSAFAKNIPMAIDENAINVSALMKYCYSEAAWRVGRVNEEINVWFADGFSSLFNRPWLDTMEVSAIVNSGAARGVIYSEAYYRTPKDEAGQVALEDWLRLQIQTLRNCVPSAPSRFIYALSGWQFPGCWTTQQRPDVDLKAFNARIVKMLATDPAFADVGGVGMTTPICSEDLFRFSFAMLRHYCLEGRTDDFAESLGMKLFPGHLRDGDFEEGFKAWTIEPAKEGSVEILSKPGFARKFEKRVLDKDSRNIASNYAVMKASAERPNRVCQTLKGLVPGNLYQIYFVSVAGADLDDPGTSKARQPAMTCCVEGAEEIRDLDHVVRMSGKGNAIVKGDAGIFVHRRVFRATGETAKLVMTDWADGKPMGEVGSRHAFHYVGCESFFVRDDVDLANICTLNRGNNLR